MKRYGVDGTIVGTHDITNTWTAQITPDDARRVVSMHIFHTWAPDDFQKVLDKWVTSGKKIAELAGDAASIIKPFIGKAT